MDKLIKMYNLPSYVRGKSFAQASKLIQDKFKDRDDKVSQDTLNALLGRLREAQESVKPKPQEQPKQQFGDGGPMFTVNGDLSNFTEQNPDMKSDASGAAGGTPGLGAYLGAVTTAMDFGNQIFGKPKVDIYGNDGAENTSGGADTLGGAMKGAKAGMSFGPLGAAIGGVVGGVSGLIGGQKRNDAINEAQQNKSSRNYNIATGNFANGGYMNKYSGLNTPPKYMTSNRGGLPSPDFNIFNVPNITSNNYSNNQASNLGASAYGADPAPESMYPKTPAVNIGSAFNDYTMKTNPNNIQDMGSDKYRRKSPTDNSFRGDMFDLGQSVKFGAEKTGKFLDSNKTALRYAPIAMNAYQLATMKKPEVERLDKLDNRYQKNTVDERRLMNAVNEGYGTGAALEGSGGSLGRYSTLSRANQLNKTKAISDAYMKVSDVNNAENTKAQHFNKATDTFNIGQDTKERDINARNRGNYDTQKSKYLSAIGTDIGQIGKEYLYKDQAENIFGYDWKGKYKQENPTATNKEIETAYEKAKKLKNK